MPITVEHDIASLTQEQFGTVAFEVMAHAFEIHEQFGRFFREDIYQNELLRRLGSRATEELRIHVSLDDFQKVYRADLVVDRGAPFELKAVDQLHEQHRSQLMNYLMLTGMNHGKLINFRSARVEHEFVNSHVSIQQRRSFRLQKDRWHPASSEAQRFEELLVAAIADWGTCLELDLYVEAMVHFFGGRSIVECDVGIVSAGSVIGTQKMRLLNSSTLFKITALQQSLESYESQLWRILQHCRLSQVLWANITLGEVSLVSLAK